MSEQGYALIRKFEGFAESMYLCPAGKPTIGYGHVIRSGEPMPQKISQDDAARLLVKDVKATEQAVCRLVEVGITQNQFDALVCLAYNIGVTAFANSTLLKLLNEGNMNAAAKQFLRWVYAGPKKPEGLIRRRAEEMALFEAKNTAV